MAKPTIRFAELLRLHINNKVNKKFISKDLTPDLLREIRDCVRETVSDIFKQSSHKLSVESMNWLSNQYFKSFRVNNDQLMSDLVVINEYKLADLPYHDIELMRNLFNETAQFGELDEEYRRRSVS